MTGDARTLSAFPYCYLAVLVAPRKLGHGAKSNGIDDIVA